MNSENYIFYSYLFASFAYIVLLAVSFFGIRRYASGFLLFIAVCSSLCWSSYISYTYFYDIFLVSSILPIETLHNLGWFLYLFSMLLHQNEMADKRSLEPLKLIDKLKFLLHSNYAISLIFITCLVFSIELMPRIIILLNENIGIEFRLLSHALFSIIGLILVEQLYRNSTSEQRWTIKFLCLGLGAMFSYDFIIYSKSLLFGSIDPVLWGSRGIVHALIVSLLIISIVRLQDYSRSFTVSRQIVFHTSALVSTGLYLIFMSLAGYYIRAYDSDWGQVAQIVFIFVSLTALLLIIFSGSVRSRFKVYFTKHFLHQRYDYREEWINLSKTLSSLHSFDTLSHFMIETLADLVDSSGGGLWIQNNQGSYYLAEEKNLGLSKDEQKLTLIEHNDPLILFLERKIWVIDLFECRENPQKYDNIDLTMWFDNKKIFWLIIPLMQNNKLKAFILLTKPRVIRSLNWEDHDLLKTVSLQLANALVLSQASDDLSTSRQFEAYSRLSAFVIHDLKNLVAQVSLLVKNAEKHKSNPEFIDDAIDTLENVVTKMQKLVSQLRQRNVESDYATFNLVDVISNTIKLHSQQRPRPQFNSEITECIILGERQQISAIIGHLVQNAQDATLDDGTIDIELTIVNKNAIVRVTDNGVGMDNKFISERLFKPFDTTKGNAGMGIGVYEAKSYIMQHSGTISVTSTPGVGTIFTIYLPLNCA